MDTKTRLALLNPTSTNYDSISLYEVIRAAYYKLPDAIHFDMLKLLDKEGILLHTFTASDIKGYMSGKLSDQCRIDDQPQHCHTVRICTKFHREFGWHFEMDNIIERRREIKRQLMFGHPQASIKYGRVIE